MLRNWLRRVEALSEHGKIAIPQQDGTVLRFRVDECAAAYLDQYDRELGRSDPDAPVHPLCLAAANSSDPTWRDSVYAYAPREGAPIPDLSE